MSDYQTTAQSRDVYQKVTDAIVNAIEQGAGAYRMPWVVRQDKGFSPISVSTVKPYRGINTLVLWAQSQSNGYPGGEFRILDYVEVKRKSGRNYWTRCPSCAAAGHDTSGDNLAISIEEPQKYKCWAGCTKEMIREALGRPIPIRRFA